LRLLSLAECLVLRLVWRPKLGVSLKGMGERRAVLLHWQLLVGQAPRPSTNRNLGLQTWKFTSSFRSFLLTIVAGYGLRMNTMLGHYLVLIGSNF